MTEIELYGAPWCPDCRRAKKFLADQRVPYVWHDIEQRPELVQVVEDTNDGKRTIPTIVFPDGSHLAEPSNEELADKLGIARVADMHVYDLVIVGGGPTGLTTAIYAARENLDTLVIDSKGLGGQAGVTERLDNYPGFPEGIAGAELADRFVKQAERYGVEMLQAVSVTHITDEGHRELDVETATGDHYHARAVLIATGSSYRRTDAEGEDDLIGAGLHFCATCDGPFYKGAEELLVIGGGNSGLEEGLFLTQFSDRVTVVEYGDRLRGSKILQDKVMNHRKMEILLRHGVRSFSPKDDGSGKLGTVTIEDRSTGELVEHHPAGVFVF
ncbi:MAG: FAD-dependent oxidoreductase, partial [Actinomycetota bacterium]